MNKDEEMEPRVKLFLNSFSYVWLLLLIAEAALVFVSWLLSTMMTDGVRSLLSAEGIRWFVGDYLNIVSHRSVICIILFFMSIWVFYKTKMSMSSQNFREYFAFRVAVIVLLLYIGVFVALTVMPHAILLSATGELYNSPFSRAIVPAAFFGLLLLSAVYRLVLKGTASINELFWDVTQGISISAPILIIWMVFLHLYASYHYVFG